MAFFIHTPRTGGISIHRHLRTKCGKTCHSQWDNKRIKYRRIRPDTFTFVRNPWDRFVSLYTLQKRHHRKVKQFSEWVMEPNGCLFWPQETFWRWAEFVGRYENFELEWEYIAGKYDLRRGPPRIFNTTTHSHYTKYYSDEAREFVALHEAATIERFGYRF